MAGIISREARAAKGEPERNVVTRDPERTRRAILAAATAEFAAHGYGGASVNAVAERAGINKRMLYHYYGNKQDLFLVVLEEAYADIRSSERRLSLTDLEPLEAMRRLVLFTWRYYLDNPAFISLLNTENLYEAQHLRRSENIRALHSPLVDTLDALLRRGVAAGVFRAGVDPVHLYISIASLGFFYLSNAHTLSTIFGRDLRAAAALEERGEHIVEVILGYLRPDTLRPDTDRKEA
ncbi:MAG: TetR/AcrR family transcriptional regulator [Tistlia sp.]|uniref:TetR/AcrR family transcriptional regulator n=1 Tax=Tistlia sp. TaxID=3057121 RepID=UPI0034A2B682